MNITYITEEDKIEQALKQTRQLKHLCFSGPPVELILYPGHGIEVGIFHHGDDKYESKVVIHDVVVNFGAEEQKYARRDALTWVDDFVEGVRKALMETRYANLKTYSRFIDVFPKP